MVVYISF